MIQCATIATPNKLESCAKPSNWYHSILSGKLMSWRCYTWFEPMGNALAARDHYFTLDLSRWIDGSWMLQGHTTVSLGPWHALSQFIAIISPKLLPLQQFGHSHWWCMSQICICLNIDGKYRTIAALKGHKVNMFCKENCLFSPRVLVTKSPL